MKQEGSEGKREKAVVRRPVFLQKLGWTGIALIVVLIIGAGTASGFAIDQYARTNPEFCAACHNMSNHVDSYLNSNHLDYVHKQAGVGCKECHASYTIQDELGSVVAYVSGDYEEPFEKRKYRDDMCLACHISLEYQANETDFLVRNPHRSHWDDLRCTSCHFSHEPQKDYCSGCHDNGGQRMIEDEIVPRVVNPWASEEQPLQQASSDI